MPRNGSGVYSAPAGTLATTLTTIKSPEYNAFVNDLVTDANAARPVVAGGTGGTSVSTAQSALSVVGYNSQTLTAAQQAQARANVSAALNGQLFGLTLSNNATDATNDIDIAAGETASSETNPVLMVLASALTKRLDATWAVGSGNGGLDTGSIANTTYHVWLIQRSDTGVVDALFSTSATSPTMPTNFDRKRRIGSIRRVAAAIMPFYQNGDYFYLQTPSIDVAANNPGTSAVLRTLSIPLGIVTKAIVGVSPNNGAAAVLFRTYISSPNVLDAVVTATNNNVEPAATTTSRSTDTFAMLEVDSNTSAQIRSRHNSSDANCFINITTYGWIDTRGRV